MKIYIITNNTKHTKHTKRTKQDNNLLWYELTGRTKKDVWFFGMFGTFGINHIGGAA
jgi:hypothetical protein